MGGTSKRHICLAATQTLLDWAKCVSQPNMVTRAAMTLMLRKFLKPEASLGLFDGLIGELGFQASFVTESWRRATLASSSS